MDFNKAKFIRSYSAVEQIGKSGVPQFAFIGRSNVGKSSLINALCSKKDMAKTSSVPGKTQLINFFGIDEQIHLVDLPGYGYAKVSKKQREVFEGIITDYLLKSPNLFIVFILVDASIPPQRIDQEFIQWCGFHRIPIGLIFTKIDKKKGKQVAQNRDGMLSFLAQTWEDVPVYFETSANKRNGIEELADWINAQFE